MATYEEGTPPKGDFAPFRAKMEAEGLGPEVTSAFENVYSALVSGATGTIPEASITPVESLASFESDISGKVAADTSLLDKTVVLKLNGGLGTGMGLDKAKSLLPVKGSDNFLDFTAQQVRREITNLYVTRLSFTRSWLRAPDSPWQVIKMRETLGKSVRFTLMNSFSTSDDTLGYLAKYPVLASDPNLAFNQNKVTEEAFSFGGGGEELAPPGLRLGVPGGLEGCGRAGGPGLLRCSGAQVLRCRRLMPRRSRRPSTV
eukprot:COSAG01_NODE_3781_length_5700_cov_10.714872_1_plen_259_part_00